MFSPRTCSRRKGEVETRLLHYKPYVKIDSLEPNLGTGFRMPKEASVKLAVPENSCTLVAILDL